MSCSSNPGRAPPVRVDGRKLTISGTSLFFKGVAWSPYNLSYSPNLGHRPDYVGFAALDAKLMQAASINVVRTYEAIGDVSVLDELWSHGIGVVMTIFLDAGYGHSVATALATVHAQAASGCAHVGRDQRAQLLLSVVDVYVGHLHCRRCHQGGGFNTASGGRVGRGCLC